MKEINLQITVDEANIVLEALGNLPFAKVFALIANIQKQAGEQISTEEQQTKTDNAKEKKVIPKN